MSSIILKIKANSKLRSQSKGDVDLMTDENARFIQAQEESQVKPYAEEAYKSKANIRFCAHCGSMIENNAGFCSNCGNKIK